MKAANVAIRQHKGDAPAQARALLALSFTKEETAETLTPDFMG